MASEAKIVISAEDRASAVLRDLRGSVDTSVAAFSKLTGVLGTLGLGAAVAGFKSIVNGLDDLSEAAQGVGVSAVALAELRQAAAFSGVEAGKLDKALSGLATRLADAAKGGEESAAIFRTLGVAIRNNDGTLRATDAVLGDLADRFAQYRDGTEKTALANALFGEKLGRVLIPYLNQGRDALREFSGVTSEAVIEAEKLQKEFDRSAANATRLKNAIAGALLPTINDSVEQFRKIDFGKIFAAGNEWGSGFNVLREFARQLKDISISAAQARIALEGAGGILDANDARARGRTTAPALPAPATAAEKTKAEQITDDQRALAGFVDTQLRELDTLREITTEQRILNLLRANPQIDTAQVREMLDFLQREVESARATRDYREQIKRIQAEQYATEKRLRDEILEAAGITDQKRIDALLRQRDIMYEMGELTTEQMIEATRRIFGLNKEIDKTRDAVDELAMVFTSSLGKLIEGGGGGIRGFFEALAQDVLKLTTRLLVLEPIAKSIKEIFKDSGSSGGGLGDIFSAFLGSLGFGGARALGGPVSAGRAYLVGERGPEMFVPGSSGRIVPNGGGAMSVTINQSFTGETSRQSARQAAIEAGRYIQSTMRRYG